MIKRFLLAILATFCLSSASLFAEDNLFKVDCPWTVTTEGLSNQQGITYELPGLILSPKNRCFWLKAEVTIPEILKNRKVYFETGNTNAAMEIYVNDVLVATHGTIDPKLNINHVSNTIFQIPQNLIKDSKVTISIRCKTDWSHASFNQFYFTDENRYEKVFSKQSFLNTTVYYMMAAICFFLCIYFLLQKLSDHSDRASLYFSFSLLFIAIYFFDMATDILFIPANLQLSISRYCLLLSISTLVLFIFRFFGKRNKLPKYIIFAIDIIFAAIYYYGSKETMRHESIFTLSMAPIFSGIIAILVILFASLKKNKTNSGILFIGIIAGLSFGVHDILYQAAGKTPFAWLQGFAFFFIDMSMFIVVSMTTIKNKKAINTFAETTSEQKDRLNEIMEKAKELSVETMNIAQNLSSSAQLVAEAASQSAKKASRIGEFIFEQNKAVKDTSDAVTNLFDSVRTVVQEVENESQVVESTIKETNLLIDGVNKVTLGIENAANFTNTLGTQTQECNEDVIRLVECMESVKDSSTEIQAIVKVVTDFFHRTNMLAMNASIEAAHSGVAGKGFAVIAHEIKKLSEASSAQAEKITDIVEQINENISSGVELSKNLRHVLENAATQASTTAITVNDSVKSMEIQKEAGSRISEATSIMSESAGAVKDETKQQYIIAEKVTTNMSQLTEYSSNAENAVNDIITNNNELSNQTDALKELVIRVRDAAAELNELIRG